MSYGPLPLAEVANSVMVPEGVTLPILPAINSVNQRLPSGPVVMNCGKLLLAEVANSVMVPEGVTLPILPPFCSVNQRLPSGPVVMTPGPLLLEEVANSVIVWTPVLMVSIACADVRPVALAVIVGLAIAAPL